MPITLHLRTPVGGRVLRDVTDEEDIPRDGLGVVPTSYSIHGPKTVPRVDYERIFVLDEGGNLLGEYALRDDCPLEYEDLKRSIPVNGMRHLVSFYQGEFAFTPFRVDNLWFVVLTRGVPRIEDRGSIGTLLAAMRAHLPESLAPAIAEREAALRERTRELEDREASTLLREQRLDRLEAEIELTRAKLKEIEADIRVRENRLNALRDYAVQMQLAFRRTAQCPPRPETDQESPAASEASVAPK